MDSDCVHGGEISGDHARFQSEDVDKFSERVCLNGEGIRAIGSSVEILTRLELYLACVSEKIVNLNVLMMHVGTRENEFEFFASEGENVADESLAKGLEFDFLSGVLDSEARELDGFITVLQSEVASARELVTSCSYEGEISRQMEEKLCDSEESLKQSQDQISEIRTQSTNLQRMLSNFDRDKNWNNLKRSEEDKIFNVNAKVQTAEQQRHVLRMLEKSLAKEMDLEKKVTELRQVEDRLKQRLRGSEQDLNFVEDEAADFSQRLFEADHSGVVLMGISKEFMGRLQILQLNLNSSVQRETQLRAKLEESIEELKEKTSSSKDTDIKLQHALASSEASQEKQDMLESTIADMDDLINNLKSKVSEYEKQVNSAECKLIMLSESHAALNEEANFLRGKLESLEASLQQADETKKVAAKGIGFQSKTVRNLVVQLAFERDRLHKKISALESENKLLAQKLVENNKYKFGVSGKDNEGIVPSKLTAETSADSSKTRENVSSISETEMRSILGPEMVRRIDAGILSCKRMFLTALVLVVAFGVYLFSVGKLSVRIKLRCHDTA